MFNTWLNSFALYFNQGGSGSLKTKGQFVEQALIEAARHFGSQHGVDPFSNTGNFEKYWRLVRYYLTQMGMNNQDFDELTDLAMSFNEGNNWY